MFLCRPQFEEGILDVALFLARKAFRDDNARQLSDPVKVARGVSRMVSF